MFRLKTIPFYIKTVFPTELHHRTFERKNRGLTTKYVPYFNKSISGRYKSEFVSAADAYLAYRYLRLPQHCTLQNIRTGFFEQTKCGQDTQAGFNAGTGKSPAPAAGLPYSAMLLTAFLNCSPRSS